MKIICVDFDGTLVHHEFPQIGPPVEGAFEWLAKFQKAGARIILWTMRCDTPHNVGPVLSDAVEFCRKQGIEFWGVNENPEQSAWTHSRKAYGHLYIDDAAFGCPLVPTEGRDVVDWNIVGPAVLHWIETGSIPQKERHLCPI